MEMKRFKQWLSKKIHETPTGELRNHYTDVQLIIGEYEAEIKEEPWKETGIVPEDFIQGTTFGIKGNIRKAIVLGVNENMVKWTFVTSTHHPPAEDSVEELIKHCTGIGPIDVEWAKSLEKEVKSR